jgi:hypothetical protein
VAECCAGIVVLCRIKPSSCSTIPSSSSTVISGSGRKAGFVGEGVYCDVEERPSVEGTSVEGTVGTFKII